jgi:hypothetical protein
MNETRNETNRSPVACGVRQVQRPDLLLPSAGRSGRHARPGHPCSPRHRDASRLDHPRQRGTGRRTDQRGLHTRRARRRRPDLHRLPRPVSHPASAESPPHSRCPGQAGAIRDPPRRPAAPDHRLCRHPPTARGLPHPPARHNRQITHASPATAASHHVIVIYDPSWATTCPRASRRLADQWFHGSRGAKLRTTVTVPRPH